MAETQTGERIVMSDEELRGRLSDLHKRMEELRTRNVNLGFFNILLIAIMVKGCS